VLVLGLGLGGAKPLERPGPEQVEGVLGCIGAAGGYDDGAVRVSRGGVSAAEEELLTLSTRPQEHEEKLTPEA
jgi:hypothetical protein